MFLNDLLPTQDTVVVELKYKGEVLKNEDGSPMTIEVYLPHTDKYRKASHAKANGYFDKERKGETFTSEELEDLGVDFVAQTTKAWNITLSEGNQPKCNLKNVKDFYMKFPSFFKQVREEVDSVEVFI